MILMRPISKAIERGEPWKFWLDEKNQKKKISWHCPFNSYNGGRKDGPDAWLWVGGQWVVGMGEQCLFEGCLWEIGRGVTWAGAAL